MKNTGKFKILCEKFDAWSEKFMSLWLFKSEIDNGETKRKKTFYYGFNIILILLAVVALGICSLHFAFGDAYSPKVFYGYLKNPILLTLNLVPPAILFFVLYGIFSRGWIAYLVDCVVVMGFTFADYFMLKFRDDPLMFMDLLLAREAAAISEEGYAYEITDKMLVCCLVCFVFVVVLFLFQNYRPKIMSRMCILAIPIVMMLPLRTVYFNDYIYGHMTDNYDHVNRWAPTQVYVSKGFAYPFINSMKELYGNEPSGYNAANAASVLEQYESKAIPENKKVNVIGVMLEAYSDVRTMGVTDIASNVYSLWDIIKAENYSGTLVTNIFAAGTIDSERAFLTGYPDIGNYRDNVNSYVRYFKSQGYLTDGSHPSEEWFYNRKHINSYLGFDDYRFVENHFNKYGVDMRLDGIVFEDFYENFKSITEKSDKPYFGFHVTYQGHGPYDIDKHSWGTDEKPLYVNDNISEQSEIIINNYLGSIKDTSWRLKMFVDKIKAEEEPVVLVLFGDHKPWLGDGNSVYNELGINLNVATAEGFLNYYSTEYVIVANDAAKELFANKFAGTGPVTSPCFLMNKLFDVLGFEGPAYMQYVDNLNDRIYAMNEVGVIDNENKFYTLDMLPADLRELYDEYYCVAYYESTNFRE